MKTVAVIGVLEQQVNSVKAEMEIISAKNIVGIDFIMGKMRGNNVVLVQTGVGKVNAAVCTQILIDLYAVDYVINIGIAEILNNELTIGGAVVSDGAYDLDLSFFETFCGAGRLMDVFFKADEELVSLSFKAAEDLGGKISVAKIVSSDRVFNDNEKSNIKNTFNADCVDFCGGAVAHTCYMNKIPFLIMCLMFDKGSGNDVSEMFSNNDIIFFARLVGKIIDMIE